jgi:hypothetical protein
MKEARCYYLRYVTSTRGQVNSKFERLGLREATSLISYEGAEENHERGTLLLLTLCDVDKRTG